MYYVHRSLHSFPTRRSSDLGAAEPAVELLRLLELLVDLRQLGVLPVPRAASHGAHARAPDLGQPIRVDRRSEEHTSELQSLRHLVCRLLLEKKKNDTYTM